MQFRRLFGIITLCVVSLVALPVFADSYIVYTQPTTAYTSSTVDYGGGNGSDTTITSLGPFTFSAPMWQLTTPCPTYNPITESGACSDPSIWQYWNQPPLVESSSTNVLSSVNADATVGATSLTINVAPGFSTVGFEYSDWQGDPQTVSAAFYNENGGLIGIAQQTLDYEGDALLFALQDTSSGQTISQVVVTNDQGDYFAIGQLRAGTPEPGTLYLFGFGLLSVFGMAYRRARA
jgi:hypothetical protein